MIFSIITSAFSSLVTILYYPISYFIPTTLSIILVSPLYIVPLPILIYIFEIVISLTVSVIIFLGRFGISIIYNINE